MDGTDIHYEREKNMSLPVNLLLHHEALSVTQWTIHPCL